MKFKTLVITSLALFMFACSDGDKDKGPDCSDAPKLSKSCLEGKWKMDATTTDRALFPDVVTTFDITEAPGTVYHLEFIVAKGNKKNQTAKDSIYFVRESEVNGHDGCGYFSISEDQTAMNIDFVDCERYSYKYSGKAEIIDENYIIFEPTKKPVFANEQMAPVSMIFKRVN